MVPKIAEGGASFIGAGAYYLGSGRSGMSENEIGSIAYYMLGDGHVENSRIDNRVGFTRLRNLSAQDPAEAFASMQATFERYRELKRGAKGRPLKDPVYSFSLSWAEDELPDEVEMIRAAEEALALLGMEAHQAILVSHVDKLYDHVHVIVNRIKPDMSGVVSKSMDRLKLSRWAETYELNDGMIRCVERVRNNALRREGHLVKDRKSKSRQEIEAERRSAEDALKSLNKRELEVIGEILSGRDKPFAHRHRKELKQLFARVNGGARSACKVVSERFRPAFVQSYQLQARRISAVLAACRSKKAVSDYVAANAHWLSRDKRDAQHMLDGLCVSQKALITHIEAIGKDERRLIGRQRKVDYAKAVETLWEDAHPSVQQLLRKQEQEIAGEGPAYADQAAAPDVESTWLSPYELPTVPVPDLVRRLNVSERGAKRLIEERRAVRAVVKKHAVKLQRSGRDVVVTIPREFKSIVIRRQLRDPAEFERWLLEVLRRNSVRWQRRQKMLRDKELLEDARSLWFDRVSQHDVPRAVLQELEQAAAAFKDALERLKSLLDEQQKRLIGDGGAKTWITGLVQQARINLREREPNDLIARCRAQCVRCYRALAEAMDNVFTAFKSFVAKSTATIHEFKAHWQGDWQSVKPDLVREALGSENLGTSVERAITQTVRDNLGSHCRLGTMRQDGIRSMFLLPEGGLLDNLSSIIPGEFAQEQAERSELLTEVSGLEANLERAAVIQRDIERIMKPNRDTTSQQLIGQIEDVVNRINLMENAGFDMRSFVDDEQRAALGGKLNDCRAEIKRRSDLQAAEKQRAVYAAANSAAEEGRRLLEYERHTHATVLIQRIAAFEERLANQEMRYPSIRSALPLGLLRNVAELKTRCDQAVKKQALKVAADGFTGEAATILEDASTLTDPTLVERIVSFERRLAQQEQQHGGLRHWVSSAHMFDLQRIKEQAQHRMTLAVLKTSVKEALAALAIAVNGSDDEKLVTAFSKAETCIAALVRAGGTLETDQVKMLERIKPLVAEANQRIEEASYYSGPSMGM